MVSAFILSSLPAQSVVSSPSPAGSDSRLATWAFPGAYANFTGNAKLPDGTPYTLQYEWKALAVTGNRAQVFTQMTLQASNRPTHIDHSVTWYAATISQPMRFAFVMNDTMFFNYDSTATVFGKTVPATVYYFDNKGSTIIVFMDKNNGFPVQFTFALDNVASITAKLTKTNIPGLV